MLPLRRLQEHYCKLKFVRFPGRPSLLTLGLGHKQVINTQITRCTLYTSNFFLLPPETNNGDKDKSREVVLSHEIRDLLLL